jgi:hypothetical protein
MSHNKLPTNFKSQTTLLDKIDEKVTADGPDGELVAFLAKKGIVLSDDIAKGVIASDYYATNLSLTKLGEKYRSERDALMLPVTDGLSGCFQYLKVYYEPEFKSLGDWDVTITNSGKITPPTDVAGWKTLLTNFKIKNDSYVSPAVSPLALYLAKKGIVLADFVTDVAAASVLEDNMKTAKNDATKAHNDMGNKWGIPMKHVRQISAFLMKLHVGNEKELGDYGFTIVDTARVLKTRNIKIHFGVTKLKQKAKVGGAFINMGTETLLLYPGKTTAGTPIMLLAGAKLIVPKGFSSFCVTNTSAVNSALLQVVPPKDVA